MCKRKIKKRKGKSKVSEYIKGVRIKNIRRRKILCRMKEEKRRRNYIERDWM